MAKHTWYFRALPRSPARAPFAQQGEASNSENETEIMSLTMSAFDDLRPKTMVWTYGAIRNVALETHDSLELGTGFSLARPTDVLLSGRDRYFMTEEEYKHAETVGAYLIYKSRQSAIRDQSRDESLEAFQHGLMAFQILKPVQTLGFIFQAS